MVSYREARTGSVKGTRVSFHSIESWACLLRELNTRAFSHRTAAAIAYAAAAIDGIGGLGFISDLPLIRRQPSCPPSSSASEEGLATE